MQCSVKTSMRAAAPKATRQVVSSKTASYNAVSKPARVVRASATDNERSAAIAAAAAAAVLLASSPVLASELPQAVVNPTAEVAGLSETLNKWFNKGYVDPTSRIKEDPSGADRKQGQTVGDTKRPIKIPTEQEAVAPEAFPNPAANIAPEPPVLASAKGDEQYGPNAGQFEGLKESDRQTLIDKASPAQSSRPDKLY